MTLSPTAIYDRKDLASNSTPDIEQTGQPSSSFNLASLLAILKRRKRPFLLTLGVISAFTFARGIILEATNPQFQGEFLLLISDPVREGSSGQASDPSGGTIESLARNTQSTDVATLIQVLQSKSVLEPVAIQMRKEGIKQLPLLGVELVQSDTRPGRPGTGSVASGVLRISSSGGNEASLKRLLELTQAAYIDWSSSQKRLQLTEGLRFLDQQEPALRSRNEGLQNELRHFRQSNNVLSPEDDARVISTQMLSTQSQLIQLSASRRQLLDILREVQQGRLTARSFSLASSSTNTTGGGTAQQGTQSGLAAGLPSQGLLNEWQRLEDEIGSAKGQYQSNSPILKGLIASQQKLKPALMAKQAEAVEAALRQNSDSIRATSDQLAKLQKEFKTQPKLLSDYQGLQQRIAISSTNLENYLKTRDQFQLEIAQNTSPWQVISPTEVKRVNPQGSLFKSLLQALMLGLVGGAAAAWLKDRLDHVYHNPNEIEATVGHPLLAHMPYVKMLEGLRGDGVISQPDANGEQLDIDDQYQRFCYQEALRNLYTSLRFLQTEERVRSIALASSVPAEGKSLITILFARTLSELGIRVLVVDSDLRKPQVHFRLGIDNIRGLSNLISEADTNWTEVVQTIPSIPNLSVITAGRRAPNPPRLLSSARMTQIISDISNSNNYDIVIYDVPPVIGLADASLISSQLDGVMLIVSLNKVDRSLPSEALKRLSLARARILGIVTNSLDAKRQPALTDSYAYRTGQEKVPAYANYGALDPSAAYSYYLGQDKLKANKQPDSATETGKQSASDKLRSMLTRFNQWLDEG